MISQFKKFFFSLIFTVALCCGLSVSAFAAEYRYGGVIAPELPAVDRDLYPYSVVYTIDNDGKDRLVYSSEPFAVATKPNYSYPGFTIPVVSNVIWYTLVNGVWRYDTTVNNDVAYGLYVGLGDFENCWVDVDVYNASGNIVFPKQKPIPVSDTVDLSDYLIRGSMSNVFPYYSSSTKYLCYGCGTTSNLIPVTPGDYVTISGVIKNAYYDVTKFNFAFLTSSGVEKVDSGQDIVSGVDFTNSGRWVFGTPILVPDDAVCIWFDLYRYGQTFTLSNAPDIFFGVYSGDSQPVYDPALSVTASNITSTTADVTFDATGLDPSKEYQIRMEAAQDSSISGIIATFSGSEIFNETVHTTDLTPDTVYSFKYTLIEDGVDTSAVSTLTYTTLPFVYDPELSVSVFSVTTNTATCQIDMTGFDPSGSYRLYYDLALSEDVGDTSSSISKGYSNQIGIVSGIIDYVGYHRFTDLSPNTEYYVAWTVEDMATGTAVPVVDSVTFTTSDDGSGGGGAGSSDDSSGILLMILNKVTAILDTLNGGQSEGILASINEKLGALIDTLANPEEQKLEDNFKGSLTEVNNNFFGDDASGQAVTVSDVGNLANTQSTVKNIFQSDYTVSDFFGIFGDTSLFAWFSAETAMDLNPNAYGGAALADMDDPYNMQSYYDNLEKVRGKR